MIRRSWFHQRREDVSCREVGKVLQSYLDGDVEDDFADKITTHLEKCKACGLEHETYTQIMSSLANRGQPIDQAAIERLRDFGRNLTAD